MLLTEEKIILIINTTMRFFHKRKNKVKEKHQLNCPQSCLNLFAKLFFCKSEKNVKQLSFAEDDPELLTRFIDHQTFSCNQDINYDIKYIHQPRVFDCGDTSTEMIINFHKRKLKYEFSKDADLLTLAQFEKKFEQRPIYKFKGKGVDDLKKYSENFICALELKDLKISELAYYLYKYGPCIAGIQSLIGHFIVIKGIINNHIITHDPWRGPNIAIPYEKFQKHWEGSLLFYTKGYSKEFEHDVSRRRETIESRP